MSELLKSAIRNHIKTQNELRIALDACLPGASGNSWIVYWVRTGESSCDIEMALNPPHLSHTWKDATSVNLLAIKTAIGCDHVRAAPVLDYKGEPAMRYFARWNKPEDKEP